MERNKRAIVLVILVLVGAGATFPLRMGLGSENLRQNVLAPRTWIVASDGTGDFTAIQPAIDASSEGDTVRIYQGTYVENVVINKRIDVIGNGTGATIVDGNRADHRDTIAITCDGVNLSGICARNTYMGHEFAGIGVRASHCLVLSNKCVDNDYGLILFGGQNTIRGNNLSSNNRNGIHMRFTNDNVIDGNDCSLSATTQGIYMEGCSGNILSNNTCSRNYKYGISLYQSSRNELRNNTCLLNGLFQGISLYLSSNNNLSSNNCSMNKVAGISIYSSTGNAMRWNHLHGNRDGIHLYQSSSCSAHSNWISGNIAFGANATDSPGTAMNATNNWWGDKSGPFHPVLNPGGLGDKVTDNVDFIPWMSGAPVNGPPRILTNDLVEVQEDNFYSVSYSAIDPESDPLTWTFSTNASWLDWDAPTRTMSGTPTNAHVGQSHVLIEVKDPYGGSDPHQFNLTVHNTPPSIITNDIVMVHEDSLYLNDYDSTDDGEGGSVWGLRTDCAWLSIGQETGVLQGTPWNGDVGSHYVNVTVDDGNGGAAWHNFTLVVLNTNDPPVAASMIDPVLLDEDSVFNHDLKDWFMDIDGDDLQYTVPADANISAMIEEYGILVLTPKTDWSGHATLEIRANDSLEEVNVVLNVTVAPVNDPPSSATIILGTEPYFENMTQLVHGSAFDPDMVYGDSLTFTWCTNTSGRLWNGTSIDLSLPRGHHRVFLNVSDTEGGWTTTFTDLFIHHVPVNDTEPPDNGTDDDDDNTTDDDEGPMDDDNVPDDDSTDDDGPGDDRDDRLGAPLEFVLIAVAASLALLSILVWALLKRKEVRLAEEWEE